MYFFIKNFHHKSYQGLKAKYPAYNFVPIYWMATEDHDFEINYFNFKEKIQMEQKVPDLWGVSTEGLSDVFEIYAQEGSAPMQCLEFI
jgi:hypothetical protein